MTIACCILLFVNDQENRTGKKTNEELTDQFRSKSKIIYAVYSSQLAKYLFIAPSFFHHINILMTLIKMIFLHWNYDCVQSHKNTFGCAVWTTEWREFTVTIGPIAWTYIHMNMSNVFVFLLLRHTQRSCTCLNKWTYEESVLSFRWIMYCSHFIITGPQANQPTIYLSMSIHPLTKR